jgi:hypothetical protein
MLFGLGDLGGWVLEFLARRNGISTIIACEKRTDWGASKVAGAAVSSGTEGFNKTIEFEKCDVFDIDRTAELINKHNPDLIYSSMSLMSWSVLTFFPDDEHEQMKQIAGTMIPMHLTLPYKLVQAVKKSGCTPVIIQNSWPDVVNPMLCNSGFNVLVGGGNHDIISSAIKHKISREKNIPMSDVIVWFVAEHVVNVRDVKKLGIPYFLKIMVEGEDITSQYDTDGLLRLPAPCPPEWISWHAHTMVASCAVKNIMAVLNDTNEFTGAPGPNGLVGGYPIRISAKGVKVELPKELSLEQAIKINTDDCKFEGIEEIKDDGTLIVTDEGYDIAKKLVGIECREIKPADSADWAKEFITAFKKLGDKYNAPVPQY